MKERVQSLLNCMGATGQFMILLFPIFTNANSLYKSKDNLESLRILPNI